MGARRSPINLKPMSPLQWPENITPLTKYFPLGTTIVVPHFHPHDAFKNPYKPHQKIKSKNEINIWTKNNCFYLFIFIFQLSCLFSIKSIFKNKLRVLKNFKSIFKKSIIMLCIISDFLKNILHFYHLCKIKNKNV